MTTGLHFTSEDWARTERDWAAWWEGELERPLVLINDFVPPEKPLPEMHFFTSNFPLEMPAEEVVERIEAFSRRCAATAMPSPAGSPTSAQA